MMASGEFKLLGKSPPLMEGKQKVSGEYQYVDDMRAELYAKILRSPHPHARINRIDTSRVENLAGVEAVLTHKDVPQRLLTRICARSCYILEDHVRFVGDEVAAVAATSEAVAEEALDLIEVDYEILPAVFDPEEATKENAPRLYPEGNVCALPNEPAMANSTGKPFVLEWGDIEKGFKEADIVVEDKFEFKPQLHTPVEPHVCIATWSGEQLTIQCPNQVPYELRDGLCHVFDMPESKVRIISPAIGGGFGAKYLERYIPITALLSKMAGGRSTKLTFTREEEQCHVKRAGGKTYVKIGARNDSKITAILFRTYRDIGGYGNRDGGTNSFWEEIPAISYKAENGRFEGWDVHVNLFSSQPMRAVSSVGDNFAIEQVIDHVAERLGMNPVEFRLNNMPDTGDIMPLKPYLPPQYYPRAKLATYPAKKLLRKTTQKVDFGRWKGWRKPLTIDGAKRRGIGVAYSVGESGFCFENMMTMTVVLNKDGSVAIISGAQDIGTGLNTTLRMLAAETLDIPLESVAICTADTDTSQYDIVGARCSRQLTTGGYLMLAAIENAKQKIRNTAAQRLKVEPQEIEVGKGKAYIKGKEEEAICLSELIITSIVGTYAGLREEVSDSFVTDTVWPGIKARQPQAMTAEVEVDIETGEVRLLKIVSGNFPGKMINEAVVKGQYIGGIVQGMGLALYEEFNYDEVNSVYLSCNLTDYKVPRALDIPIMENVILEEAQQYSAHMKLPYGAMGVGEMTTWGLLACIANAIYNAIGVRIRKAPMTAEVILEALEKETGR